MIVVGPGSLYTSLLPNLLVNDLLGAVESSRSVKVYVCNIATQTGETDMLTSCYDHVEALEEHVGDTLFDIVLCNDNYKGQLYDGSRFVIMDDKTLADSRVRFGDLADDEYAWRHDSKKLAEALITILAEYTGPLE
jgi:uncharacterized cofD-like protein